MSRDRCGAARRSITYYAAHHPRRSHCAFPEANPLPFRPVPSRRSHRSGLSGRDETLRSRGWSCRSLANRPKLSKSPADFAPVFAPHYKYSYFSSRRLYLFCRDIRIAADASRRMLFKVQRALALLEQLVATGRLLARSLARWAAWWLRWIDAQLSL